ncbi:E3 ubiquitin-protein ligase RBBP6 [Elysia marginata]|uniref:E3 ubiquitin-protein ligase RBBP6 n=1 Tax=Elysia marginata TaxID=1093978 RepID=A0AAV4II41_9GAST|nr:E3 ubiquitin-protein ligase RBBP6 [Elysia marginata]
MSCIHYKFKSSLDYNSVTFDGLHLSLTDLKKAISHQRRLKPGEFDLEITNAQTGDVYKKGDELIAKNTSVIVSRVPVTRTTASSTQKSWEAFKQECAKVVRVSVVTCGPT